MSEDANNVHELPNRERDAARGNLEAAKRAMAGELAGEAVALAAQMRKKHYDALRAEGFNEYQALVIVAKML